MYPIGPALAFLLLASPARAESESPVPIPPLSLTQAVLIACALTVCIACIWIVFFFGRRLQSFAYLRDSLVTIARQEELKILLRELDDRAKAGPLDPTAPPPDEFGPPAQIWTDGYVPYHVRLGDENAPPDETPDQANKRRQRLAACKQWETEERARYKKFRDAAELNAEQHAAKKIPQSMDISLLGGGWSFLLEFSTVIVIIFTLMVLGIGQIVSGKDISTILAAVAGYVLGKASAGAQRDAEKPKG